MKLTIPAKLPLTVITIVSEHFVRLICNILPIISETLHPPEPLMIVFRITWFTNSPPFLQFGKRYKAPQFSTIKPETVAAAPIPNSYDREVIIT